MVNLVSPRMARRARVRHRWHSKAAALAAALVFRSGRSNQFTQGSAKGQGATWRFGAPAGAMLSGDHEPSRAIAQASFDRTMPQWLCGGSGSRPSQTTDVIVIPNVSSRLGTALSG